LLLAVLLEGSVDRPVDARPPSVLHMKSWVVEQGAATLAAWGRAAGRLRQDAGEGAALEVLQAELAEIWLVTRLHLSLTIIDLNTRHSGRKWRSWLLQPGTLHLNPALCAAGRPAAAGPPRLAATSGPGSGSWNCCWQPPAAACQLLPLLPADRRRAAHSGRPRRPVRQALGWVAALAVDSEKASQLQPRFLVLLADVSWRLAAAGGPPHMRPGPAHQPDWHAVLCYLMPARHPRAVSAATTAPC
jgi:hypothetical protein